jgi:RNA polymerase sigma factor (sigma-70 family)
MKPCGDERHRGQAAARPLSRGYTREPGAEAAVAELLSLSPRELKRRLAVQDYQDPACPRLEDLVCVLRMRLAGGRDADAGEIAECLVVRSARTIASRVRKLSLFRKDEAEDAEAETVLRLIGQLRSLEPSQEFWEVRYMVCLERLVKDVVRQALLQRRNQVEFSALDTFAGDAVDSVRANEAVSPDDRVMIAAALSSLGDEDRQLVALRYVEQFTEEEIAAILGTTSRTVRNRLARARERLQRWREEE